MDKIHGFSCKALDTNNKKDCDCYLSKPKKHEPTENELKAIVMHQYLENQTSKQMKQTEWKRSQIKYILELLVSGYRALGKSNDFDEMANEILKWHKQEVKRVIGKDEVVPTKKKIERMKLTP